MKKACRRMLAAVAILTICTIPAMAMAQGAATLNVDGDAASFALDGYLEVLRHAGAADGIDDIAGRDDFLAVTKPILTTGTLWYRFTALRKAGMPADWILGFGEPDIDDIRIFVPAAEGEFSETRLGRVIPSADLALAARRHVALLTLPEAKPVTIYIRLASQHKIRFEEAALWRPNALIFDEARQSTLHGIHFGILAVIVTVYALFGIWLRDGAMLIYALFVGTNLGRGISHTGTVTLLFPEFGSVSNYLLSGGGMIGGIAAFIFMWDKILDLKTNFPVMHRLYTLVGAIVAASLLTILSPYFSLIVPPAHLLMLVASISSIVLATILVRRHPQNTLIKFYRYAFVPIVLVWAAEIGAAISPSIPADLGRHLHNIATLIHIVILGVALTYRLKLSQLEQLRAEAALAGERLARQRQRTFIDMATHEFKTPLAVIDSAAQILAMRSSPTFMESERIATIRRAVKRLVKLIDTCLAGERAEVTALQLQSIAPADIVSQAAERHSEPDQIDLTIAASDLPQVCLADPDLLGIALDALVDNARRYGPVGQAVELTAQAEGGQITFAVHDRGPGIPPEEVAYVFDKYYRCTSSAAVAGTGIGLHLVKTIADLHGGQVTYRPRKGGGSSFALTIPAMVRIPEPAR